ncbi:MAG: prepilin-type N-terminal cleavage/methylation domain-containing protein [Candidatus Omnitrophica bacterium]|nr:prepilin-type N-terminal cleavage/methylation domain-containing protein [Candidatus Omnitrophota bacterium]
MRSEKGLTLIEVMVAISIASLLTLGIERLLDTALTSWRIAIEEVSISKLSEDMMRQMTEGDDQFSGLRDAAQLIDAGKVAVTFVPMWTDVFDLLPRDGKFYLTKRLRPGAPPPMSEVKFKGARDYVVYPVLVKAEEGTNKQYGEFGFPIKPGATVRFSYQPDVKVHPELIMKYEWDSKLGKIRRFYNRIVHDFNEREEAVKTTAVEFSYLDGGNQAVDIEGRTLSKANALVRISSVKIDLEMQGKQMTKRAVTLVNLRSLGKGGQGVIL